MGDTTPLLRRRWRTGMQRTFLVLPLSPSIGTVLRQVPADAGHVVVLLVGSFGRVDSAQRWAEGDLPPDYAADDRGHFIAASPHLRFTRGRQRVELLLASDWFGTPAESASADQVLGALRRTHGALRRAFDPKAELLMTPLSTGRELFLRSLPRGAEHRAITRPLASTIIDTSPQGRMELLPPPPGREGQPVELVEYDARLGYVGAMTGNLPTELLAHDDRPFSDSIGDADDEPSRALGVSRFRGTVYVPQGWAHVGLAPVRRDGEWCYPAEPGESFDTWLSGAEVFKLQRHGWTFACHERLLFREGRPLRPFASRMLKALDVAAEEWPDEAMVRTALRAIALRTLGGFAQRSRMVTRSGPLDALVPAYARRVRAVDGRLTWQEESAQTRPEWLHAHWPAAVWARQRVGLLEYAGRGALSLPLADVVAFRTDALWLAADPGWTDDGRPGTLRRKEQHAAPAWPTSVPELLNVRN